MVLARSSENRIMSNCILSWRHKVTSLCRWPWAFDEPFSGSHWFTPLSKPEKRELMHNPNRSYRTLTLLAFSSCHVRVRHVGGRVFWLLNSKFKVRVTRSQSVRRNLAYIWKCNCLNDYEISYERSRDSRQLLNDM